MKSLFYELVAIAGAGLAVLGIIKVFGVWGIWGFVGAAVAYFARQRVAEIHRELTEKYSHLDQFIDKE